MRRAVAWGSIAGVLVLLVLDAALSRAGLSTEVLPHASGAGPWLVSRAAGLTAYVALSLEITLGLLVSTGVADRVLPRARTVELHRWLSGVAIGLVGAHAVALLGDGFVGYDALDLTVPFVAAPRRLATGLGVLSAYALLGLHLSFAARGKIGARTWRKLHYGSFLLYVTATVHGISAGTDTGQPYTTLLYAASGLVVATLLGARVVLAVEERATRAARATSVAP